MIGLFNPKMNFAAHLLFQDDSSTAFRWTTPQPDTAGLSKTMRVQRMPVVLKLDPDSLPLAPTRLLGIGSFRGVIMAKIKLTKSAVDAAHPKRKRSSCATPSFPASSARLRRLVAKCSCSSIGRTPASGASRPRPVWRTEARSLAQECMRLAKSSTRPRKAKTWCALKFKWAPVLAF